MRDPVLVRGVGVANHLKPIRVMADDHVAKRTDRGLGVQEPVLASWAAILRSVNGSRLVLKDRTLIDSSQQAGILTASALLDSH